MAALTAGPDLSRLRRDFPYFTEVVLGLRLWRMQRKAAAAKKFVTCIAAPRRTGKSTLIEADAIWTCFREPGVRVLIVSASESSARDRIEEIQLMLARSPETAGSTTDELKSRIDFLNGSAIISKPASPKAIRGLGKGLKLLVVDEASLVSEEVWAAAMFTALDHKAEGSRIVVADVPWGSREHWYRKHFELGTDRRHPDVASFSWTYEENPALDGEYLRRQQDTMTYARYRSDVLGEWADDEEAAFPHSLLMGAVADFETVAPEEVQGLEVMGGVDYGFVGDASALACIGALADLGLNQGDDARTRFVVCHLELYRPGEIDPLAFVPRLVETAQRDSGGIGFRYAWLGSERNGIGEYPTQQLYRGLEGRRALMWSFSQSQETKAVAFGRLRALMAEGRLVIPRNGELLRALGSLTTKITQSGGVSIEAVSERGTHADLAFALAAATAPWARNRRMGCGLSSYDERPWRVAEGEAEQVWPLGRIVSTGSGVRLPARPLFADLGGGHLHRAGERPYLAGRIRANDLEEIAA